MFSIVKKLFNLLNKSQQKRFYSLQLLVVFMAILEIVSVASIIPFMTLVGDSSQLYGESIIALIYSACNLSTSEFMFLLGLAVLGTLLISSLFSMFTIWKLSMFATQVGTEISDSLYSYYLSKCLLFHASGSSAQLTTKIAGEAGRVSKGIVMPLMQMNARIVLAIFICIVLFIYDVKVAIIGLSVFSFAYVMLYKIVRTYLLRNGRVISDMNGQRFELMNEAFGGIKDILLLGRANYFVNRFKQTSLKLIFSQGTNTALTQVPVYLMQLIAYGSMISLVLYLISSHSGDLGLILPILSVYGIATFKLIPAFQHIYSSFGAIKSNIPALESIQKDLNESNKFSIETDKKDSMFLRLKKSISLKNISFCYPGKYELTLKQINITIPAYSVVGIVGPTGSGKSTLINILLGLIKPTKGKLLVDQKTIDDRNLRLWQNSIGYVAQNIFLSEGSIAENVAFGIPKEEIKIEKVYKSLERSNILDHVMNLENGIDTKVGERGIKLSGGQQQRIGIARALYNEADVLIFDEATSSLDGHTEKVIMNSIQEFSGKKTIIMIAHRLKTVEKCDQIFLINEGLLADQGNYQELFDRNQVFRNMAIHA